MSSRNIHGRIVLNPVAARAGFETCLSLSVGVKSTIRTRRIRQSGLKNLTVLDLSSHRRSNITQSSAKFVRTGPEGVKITNRASIDWKTPGIGSPSPEFGEGSIRGIRFEIRVGKSRNVPAITVKSGSREPVSMKKVKSRETFCCISRQTCDMIGRGIPPTMGGCYTHLR